METSALDEMRDMLRKHERQIVALEQQLTALRERTSVELQEIRNELRERIQHLLDEQRVALRQMSLESGEQAVAADRARRVAETRLDEFARKLDALLQPPA